MVSPNENARRAAALKKLVETPLAPGTTLIVVTHKPNIMDALGRDWFDVREGGVDLPARSGGIDAGCAREDRGMARPGRDRTTAMKGAAMRGRR